MAPPRAEPVWAIACYFPFDDPVNTHRRLAPYRHFRAALEIPLVTVELSLTGEFHLAESDADVLIQLTGGALLWQKERLLNLALRALPPECDTVAWIDCDVVMMRAGWSREAREALRDVRLLQPFRTLYYLPEGSLSPERHSHRSLDSICKRFVEKKLIEDAYTTQGLSQRLGYAPGMVWVASRALLDRHGLYDGAILGSGDKMMFSAAAGRATEIAGAYGMSAPHRKHFLDWAGPFAHDVAGQIGYLEGDACHLWHGDLQNRLYHSRYDGFGDLNFDPSAHLTANADGVWCWNGPQPALDRFVRDVFARRASTLTVA